MYARTTLFEIDPLRISLDSALDYFKENVLPGLQAQTGYKGVLAMSTPEGRGMLVSLWETEAEAAASIESGFYDEQVQKFLMLLRQPPGRDHYEVLHFELQPAVSTADGGGQ